MGVQDLRSVFRTGDEFLEQVVRLSLGTAPPPVARATLDALYPGSSGRRRCVRHALRGIGVDGLAGLIWYAGQQQASWSFASIVETLDESIRLTPAERVITTRYLMVGRVKAAASNLSTRTVEWHLANVRRRLEVPAMDCVPWRVSTIIGNTWRPPRSNA